MASDAAAKWWSDHLSELVSRPSGMASTHIHSLNAFDAGAASGHDEAVAEAKRLLTLRILEDIDRRTGPTGGWQVSPKAMCESIERLTASNSPGLEGNDLPDVEIVSAKAHEAWMNAKLKSGFTTRKSESGEELMVPYSELTEAAKDLDRQVVLTIYAAIKAASNSPGLDGKQEAVDRAHNDAIEQAADFVSGMQHVKGTPNAIRKLKRVAPTPSRDVTGKER